MLNDSDGYLSDLINKRISYSSSCIIKGSMFSEVSLDLHMCNGQSWPSSVLSLFFSINNAKQYSTMWNKPVVPAKKKKKMYSIMVCTHKNLCIISIKVSSQVLAQGCSWLK